MQYLKDQLIQIDKELDSFEKSYARYFIIEKWINNSNVISGFVSVAVTIFISVLIFKLDFFNEALLGLVVFYGFIFAAFYLHTPIAFFFEFLIRKYFKISKSDSEVFTRRRDQLYKQRNEIKKQIDIEEKKEIKRLQYIQEDRFISELENLVNSIGLNNRSEKGIVERLKNLENEYQTIKRNGFQIRTRIFYENRFNKINSYFNDSSGSEKTKTLPRHTFEPKDSFALAENTVKISETDLNPNIPIEKDERFSNSNEIDLLAKEQKEMNNDFPRSTIPIVSLKQGEILYTSEPKKPVVLSSSQTTIDQVSDRYQEKSLMDLFGVPKENIEKRTNGKSNKNSNVKVDFSKLNEFRKNIGELGELYVFQKEQEFLFGIGRIKESGEVVHISLNSDTAGYDITSFTESGERKYIEVKTTTGNEYEPFYMTNNEMDAMQRLKNYWIYRVYNFDTNSNKGSVYKIDCSKELDPYYNILPAAFKISPKK